MVFLKSLIFIVLLVGILIPIRYGSINPRYVSFRLIHSILSIKNSFIQDENRPMLSAEYRAFESILRAKSEMNLNGDPLNVVNNLRSSFSMSNLLPKPSGCNVNKEIFSDDKHSVDTYWINNIGRTFLKKESEMLLIYYHGGGYMVGNMNSHIGIECHLSKLFNMSILHVEYRLIPEHPLPLAVEDTLLVYRQLLNRNLNSSQMFLMGDSAGGGLTLLTVQSLLKHQLNIPRGIIVLSPWADLTVSAQSYIRNQQTEIIVSSQTAKWISSYVLGINGSHLSLDNPLLSPLHGSFEGFPPMYINVGTAEILEDDARAVFNKAKEANVDVTFEEGLHLCHCYPIFYPFYPEAQHTLNNIQKWIFNKS